MQFLTALINLVRRDEEGQGLAEYALILALIAIVAIIALIFLGTPGVGHPQHRRRARSNDRPTTSQSAQDRRALRAGGLVISGDSCELAATRPHRTDRRSGSTLRSTLHHAGALANSCQWS